MIRILNQYKQVVFLLFTVLVFLASYTQGIFWDNVVYVSKMGNYLFENGLFQWVLPDDIDSGHQPTFGFLNAVAWTFLGKHLWVSHLVMFPFVYGTFVQLYKLVGRFISNEWYRWAALFFILADPTLQAQLFLVNPELLQIFFFLLALNSLYENNKVLKIIALFFLGAFTYRGMMLCAGFFLFDFLQSIWLRKESVIDFIKSKFLVYVLGSSSSVLYLIFRLTTKGWLKSHPDSPWADDWQTVGVEVFFKNVAVLAHRYLDFGRVFIFVPLLLILVIGWRKYSKDLKVKELILLSLASVLLIVITSLGVANPMGHRYFVVSFIAVLLLVFYLFYAFDLKKVWLLVLFTGLSTGNLWVYPDKISQGWDASLSHLSYFNLRQKMLVDMQERGVEIQETASFFPNRVSIDEVDLNGDTNRFLTFSGKEPFVLYSNVYNLSDEEFLQLENNYEPLITKESMQVKVILYRLK